MTRSFEKTFGTCKVSIGVVHLLPLPGSPDFGGSLDVVIERGIREAEVIAGAGFGGLIVENYGDLPFIKQDVGPETIAAIAVTAREIKKAVRMPIGVNVLRNDAEAGLAIAAVCSCEFIRVNVLVGVFATSEGLIEGSPGRILRMREQIAPQTMIFADVMVKHAYSLGSTTVGDDVLDVAERGCADCLIVTGTRTGRPPSGEDVKMAKARAEDLRRPVPVLVGSGVTPTNVEHFFKLSDGIIVGSYIRKDGRAGGEIDSERALEIGSIIKEAGD